MFALTWKLLRLLVAILVLGIGLYLGGPFLLGGAGRYLIRQDPLGKADLILVLSGQPYLRVPEAARLYHDGRAPAILLVNEPKAVGMEDLQRVGIRFPDEQEISVRILEALRVPRGAIRLIEDRCTTVRTEMEAVARFLNAHPVREIIIVASKSQSTRARKIFAGGLGSRIRIIMHPVPNDPFDADRWWQSQGDSRQVLHEYQALADYWRRRLWRLLMGEFRVVPPSVQVR